MRRLPPGRSAVARRRRRRGASFRNNRFVLTGEPGGRLQRDAVDDLQRLQRRRRTTCCSGRRRCRIRAARRADDRGAAGGQRQLQRDRELDRTEAVDAMTQYRAGLRSHRAWPRSPAALGACGGGIEPASATPRGREPAATPGSQQLSFAYFQKCVYPIFLAQLQIQGQRELDQHLRRLGLPRQRHRHRRRLSLDRQRAAARPRPTRPTRPTSSARATCTRTSTRRRARWCSARRRRAACSPSRWCSTCCTAAAGLRQRPSDPNAKLITYWITHPVPLGQDEFSSAANSMFTPADPNTGTCNTQ